MSIEAMKQALEALLFFNEAGLGTIGSNEAITSLRQAIAEAEKQPQRQWVGLTEEEVNKIYMEIETKVNEHWDKGGTELMFPITLYKAFEAKLKENNGG